MFKCSECGAEYKTKPDYCDCGNDSFEEIVTTKKEFSSPLKRYDIDIFSLSFFIICLILSALVIMFFANPKPQTETQKVQPPKPMVKQIPNIETFWDNTPIQTVVNVVEEPQQPQTIVEKIIKKEPVKVMQKQKVEQKQKTQTQPQPQKPIVKQQAKPVTKTTPVKQQVVNNKEVQNYKLRLRNALFYKLNYSAIHGSGKCGIQFAVNSDGKLINRAFTFQSDNKTLNDEVYKMLMRLPTFDPPPKSYNGELIKLTIRFDNGEYEVLFSS